MRATRAGAVSVYPLIDPGVKPAEHGLIIAKDQEDLRLKARQDSPKDSRERLQRSHFPHALACRARPRLLALAQHIASHRSPTVWLQHVSPQQVLAAQHVFGCFLTSGLR